MNMILGTGKYHPSIVYGYIGGFIKKSDRLRLVRKFESDGIRLADLYGDHVHFEGILIGKKDIIIYRS